MTHTSGQAIRRQSQLTVLGMMTLIMSLQLILPGSLQASELKTDKASVISPQLLDKVDQLLATSHGNTKPDVAQSMGPLVQMAQHGRLQDIQVMSDTSSQNNLKVTAVPLPDAFGMSLMLLGILVIAYLIQRVRHAM